MRHLRSSRVPVLFLIVAGFALAAATLSGCAQEKEPSPWDSIPQAKAHVDHGSFFVGESFEDGPSVTRACLECHEQEAHNFMLTSHWTWKGDTLHRANGETVEIGKANLINNFCIGIQSNEARCTSCHAGYGWRDNDFDFSDATLVDCLICHDNTGSYRKATTGAGHPEESVDLMAVAQGVGRPTRQNCGYCHFRGGGGDAVKHGDLDGSMYFPTERIDVHMGRYDFNCIDCHQAENHEMPGRSMSVSVSTENRLYCTDCHDDQPHESMRLNAHTEKLACGSCHIPYYAIDAPTKMSWDWSQAGEDRGEQDPHVYNKKKGSFVYGQRIEPEYLWYNGESDRYLTGEEIDPEQVTNLNWPHGGREIEGSKIWPFKVHRGKQIYDLASKGFVVPNTYGEGGYWEDFDWDKALRQGSERSGLPYSGEYGFAATAMYWPLAHMVASANKALQCNECHAPHGEPGRLDWEALGYDEDPLLGPKAMAWEDHPELELGDMDVATAGFATADFATAVCADCHEVEEIVESSAHPAIDECNLCHVKKIESGGATNFVVSRADNESCGACHGGVVDGSGPVTLSDIDPDDEFVLHGGLFSPQRLADSGWNIEDKASLGRPFDLHAARGVGCGDCHDVHTEGTHGRTVSTKQCVDCHEALSGHEWLPEKLVHFERVACESCHVGTLYLPEFAGDLDPAQLITATMPEYRPRIDLDGEERLAPYRVIDERSYSLHHGLATGRYALRDCGSCHEQRVATAGGS